MSPRPFGERARVRGGRSFTYTILITLYTSLQMINTTKPFLSRRIIYLLGLAVCAGLIAFALYLQHKLGEDPCALCIFQRVAVAALGVVFLIAGLHNPQALGNRVYALLALAIALIGGGIAARHVWLQHLPKDQVPECGPGLSYLMESQPWLQVLRNVLQGSGECAEVGWTFLRLSIPEWTLICFVGFAFVAIFQLRNRGA
jgi:protein dithiol:quinone oxidoreductase